MITSERSERTEIFIFCILKILFHAIWISCWSVAYFVDTIGVPVLVFVTLVMKGPVFTIYTGYKHVAIYTISLWARGITENVALFASETHAIHLSNLLVNNIFCPCLCSFDSHVCIMISLCPCQWRSMITLMSATCRIMKS